MGVQSTHQRSNQMHRKQLVQVLCLIMLFVSVATWLLIWVYRSTALVDINSLGTTENFGQFGDYVGGILNPLFGFSTVVLLVWSLMVQREELSLTREELGNSTAAFNLQNKLTMYEQSRSFLMDRIREEYDGLNKLYVEKTAIRGRVPEGSVFYKVRQELGNEISVKALELFIQNHGMNGQYREEITGYLHDLYSGDAHMESFFPLGQRVYLCWQRIDNIHRLTLDLIKYSHLDVFSSHWKKLHLDTMHSCFFYASNRLVRFIKEVESTSSLIEIS